MTLSPHNAKIWAQKTFGTAALGDTRRTHRLIEIAGRMAQSSGKSASLSCEGNSALLEAKYRFNRNDNIHPDKIRRAGFEQTAKAVQDVTVHQEPIDLRYPIQKGLGNLSFQ